MDTKRVAKLREWLNEFDGRVGTFCRHYGLDHSRASFLSQVLSGHRSLGEKAARRLEEECKRPVGWLDQQAERGMPISLDLARIAALPESDRNLIQDFVVFVIERREKHRSGANAPPQFNVEAVTLPSRPTREKILQAAHRPLKESENERENAKRQRRKA